MKKKLPVSKNEDLILTIEDLTYQGMGVAKVDSYPLFIEGALPQEKIIQMYLLQQISYQFTFKLQLCRIA